MTDREKVTNLIRELQRYEPQCTDYFKDVIDAVIELLKEQEAVKPIKPIYQGDDSYTCDNCGETIGWDEMECYGIGKIRYKFCPGCGRRVKWDGSDRNGNG